MSDPQMAQRIYRLILQTFAQTGHPPSAETIAGTLNLPDVRDVLGELAALEAEGRLYRDPQSGVILAAYPFSAMPTPHRVVLGEDRQVYAMCAVDALGMPFLLGTDAEIRSSCAHCEASVAIHIVAGQVTTATEGLVIVYTAPHSDCCAATAQCPYINFFCSPGHAQAWQARHPELAMKILSLPEALERGKAVFGSLLQVDP